MTHEFTVDPSNENVTVVTANDERPDFAALIPNPASRAMVQLAYDAHIAYAAAHFARYGAESAGFKAWRDAQPVADVDYFDMDCETLSEDVRTSGDPSVILAHMEWLTAMLTSAKANLQGCYASKDKPLGEADPNADVAALRDTLDNLIAACVPLTATPLLDAGAFWSVLPGKVRKSKSGSERMVYDGPSIPQTRQSSPVRANAKLTLVVHNADGSTAEYNDGQFGENVKAVLRLDMAELKSIVGDFSEAGFGRRFTTPAGVTFSIVKRPVN